jgi:Family of unknown function (DUF5937)/Bacterial regulatory protein, arsR family
VRSRLADAGLDLAPLADLVPVPTRVLPGFLAPTPVGPLPDLHAELARLRAVPADVVRADLDGWSGPPAATVAALRDDPAAGLDRLAAVVAAYWDLALAPYWPRLRGLLEGDVAHRARQVAEGGIERMLNTLYPTVRWAGGTLRVAHRHQTARRALDGRGLVLVPSAFVWPLVFSKVHEPWQPVLRYPARGTATLWDADRTSAAAGLAAVVGRGRATLLAELEHPASTTELARRTGLSPGGVSQHLSALRSAGLVTATRSGRQVLYARTAAADALFAAPS